LSKSSNSTLRIGFYQALAEIKGRVHSAIKASGEMMVLLFIHRHVALIITASRDDAKGWREEAF